MQLLKFSCLKKSISKEICKNITRKNKKVNLAYLATIFCFVDLEARDKALKEKEAKSDALEKEIAEKLAELEKLDN